MKIGIYVLNINKHFPEMWELSYPSLEHYANKIGARLNVIVKRKFLDWHIKYEKAQVFGLGKMNDWNIIIDSDVIIHPDCPNFIERVPDFNIGLRDEFLADTIFDVNNYFYRDRRKVGVASAFAMASHYCHDFWTPLEGKMDKHINRIHPSDAEIKHGIKPEHLITDYWLSNNLSKYGFKYTGILKDDERWMFFHPQGVFTKEEKIKQALEWKSKCLFRSYVPTPPKPEGLLNENGNIYS